MHVTRMRIAPLCCADGTSSFYLRGTVSPGCYRRMGGFPYSTKLPFRYHASMRGRLI